MIWRAARFIENGWSLKWLHREIMLSATYQQRSSAVDAGDAVESSPQVLDPENRWLWRMNRRRLEVEAWRDAMLAASGELDERLGGAPANLAELSNRRRTIYGRVDRHEVDDLLRLNDFPDPASHNPKREPTTTALQQLVVLNGPAMRERARNLASRLAAQAEADEERIRLAYRLLFCRVASDAEIQLGLAFLRGADSREERLVQYSQVLLGGNEFLFID
jgi:hypothetical protein